MINISKSGNAIKFVFTDSDHYLYGNGEIEVPVNSLSLIVDESNMVTFRKANSNDIFLSFNPSNSNLSDKAGVIEFYKDNMVGSTGGGSGSGMTPSEVQEMIDAATSGIPSSEVVEALRNDLNTVSGDVENKQDALEYYSEAEYPDGGGRGMINVYNGKTYTSSVEADAGTTDGGTYASLYAQGEAGSNALKVSPSGVTINDAKVLTENDINPNDIWDTIDDKEEVIASALTEVRQDVADIDAKEEVIASALTEVNLALDNKLDASAYTPTDLSQYWTSAQTQSAIDDAKAYYVDFGVLTTQGIHDADWDGLVNAINAHRPIYAELGSEYYTAECLAQSGNQIIMTASNHLAHFIYTFTKNDSENYSFDYGTKPYVTDTEKAAWNAKQDALSAGTGIEISGNVISATGGGGATYSAGYGINIDTANTISFNMPITCTTNTNNNITIGNGANNGSWSLLVGNDMSITKSYGAIGLCVSDMSVGGSSISGNTRGVLIGCTNTIKGGDTNVGGGVAIGDRNESTGGGIVIGTASKASGSSTVAIGLSANATGTTKMNLNNQIKVDTNNQVYIKDKTNTTDVCIQDAIAALGGLKFVQCSQSEYDALVSGGTVDSSTIYFITNVVS